MTKKLVFALFVLSLILGSVFRLSEGFAEFYTINVAPLFRVPLSFISSFFPFSLGESLILTAGVLALALTVSVLFHLITGIFGKKSRSSWKSYGKILAGVILFFYFTYVFAFSSAYSRIPVSRTLGVGEAEMNTGNVSVAVERIIGELSELSEDIAYTEAKGSHSGMDFGELAVSVRKAAERAADKYPIFQRYLSTAKPIAFSLPMAYTGISGVYSFFTGESNVNTVYSHYTLPFTMAHEYAHQMGIGSEKEAEFAALLICLESDVPYIRYSGYSQAFITLSNILYGLDENVFYQKMGALPDCLAYDIYLSALNSRKFSDTKADEIASAVNDVYLSVSGDGGIISYSLSARLYTAYFLRSDK